MGEADGFADFVAASSRSLLRTGWLLTGNWASAEDLVQVALVKAWQRWDHVHEDSASAYVRSIMTSTFLGWRRRRWTSETPHGQVPDGAAAGDYTIIDTRHDIQVALRGLSRQQRAAVVLRYFADLSEADTAAAMGCSPGAVKVHTSRAMTRLRSDPSMAALLTAGEDVR